MIVTDTGSMPTLVALSTLSARQAFYNPGTGKHYVLAVAPGSCFCLEDDADVQLAGTTMVMKKVIEVAKINDPA